MKKIKFFTMLTVLLISSLGLFSIEKADAASSGWITQSGINAKVSTNKDSYSGNERIVVTGEKTGTGKYYYIVSLDKLVLKPNYPWEEADSTSTLSFTSKTPEIYLNHTGKGTYQVQFKIFKDAATNEYLGSWNATVRVN
ncbi:hypothetical protein VO178_09705 [Lysinibacillus fusiformis]|uniref:hypothetical protein n=1 Tax=Lysinibacillus fusiformis TaxID=28031 RepID=UPI002D772B8A|nr:hypothetical protein [Lysinibacillus fusiformis]WRS99949.1 hypothetical protein VO178_09705 [Lysinibacillus fusiformis]